MNKYKLKFVIIFLFGLISCNNIDNYADIRLENQELRKENDSLRGVVDSLHIIPFIDNTVFETRVGEPYRMHLLGVLKNEIQIQELLINRKQVDIRDTGLLKYDEYGAFLTFEPDTSGIYEFKANTTFKHWGEKLVPLSWPLEVSEN